jgi:hypothetical protein
MLLKIHMQLKSINQLCLIGMMGIVTFAACTKDSKEDANLSQRNAAPNAFIYYEQNQLETKLNQFWVNYQLFLGLEADAPHTLGATVGLDEATTLLHYALNIAFVDPRTAYDQEVDGMFEKNIIWPQGEQITNQQLCSLFHDIATDIKNARNQITDANKAINRLEIIPQVAANSISFQIKYLLSHGNVWSKEDLSDPANYTPGINFNAPTPWLSQQSFEGLVNPNNQTTGMAPSHHSQLYYMWLFGDNDDPIVNPPTLTDRRNRFNSSLSNEKAVHQYFTSRAVYWPNPVQQLNQQLPVYVGVKPVMTPKTFIPGVGEVEIIGSFNFLNTSNNGAVLITDVIDCNNPQAPAIGGSPDANSMVYSKLLGYYQKEFQYGFTSARRVEQNTLNYFWSKRADIAVTSMMKNSGSINRMMNYFNSGFYAMTGYNTTFNRDKEHTGQCVPNTQCFGPNMCLNATEYYMEGTFSHYRLLPLTPVELAQYF